MDLHQLKTLTTVALQRSITRAAELLHLSQPAVSAQIKAIEDELGLTLFERTPRGMSLTSDGQRILAKAEQALGAHQDLMAEATRIKGRLTGRLRLGAGSNSHDEAVGHLLTALAERFPELEVGLEHGSSREILAGIRKGTLDAGYYNEAGEPEAEFRTIEVSRFGICLAAPRGSVATAPSLDWQALAGLPWIHPTASTCCGRTAEHLFQVHGFRPRRFIEVDRENLTRALIASGVGVGILHRDTAHEARSRGEVDLLFETADSVRVLFAWLASRARDPLLTAVSSLVHTQRRP